MTDGHFVANLSDLEDREPFPVDVGDEEIALILMDGEVFAISNICPHEYSCLSDGHVEEDRIVCQLHQAEFHIPTGKVVQDPAVEDLATYTVKIAGDEIYIQF